MILRAVLYRLREGGSWRSLSIFAPYTTIYTRWKQWCEDGVWEKILKKLTHKAKGKLWSIDASCIKVHKHGFGAVGGTENQSIGKTKGGWNTKVHALTDNQGRPVSLLLGAGNRHDLMSAPDLVEGQTNCYILADKAYDSDSFRDLLGELGLTACIPPKANRKNPASYHKGYYKKRHHVENYFQRIKEHRAVSTRYEKLDERFLGLVTLASIKLWL